MKPTFANIGKWDDPISKSNGGPWVFLRSREFNSDALFNHCPIEIFNIPRTYRTRENLYKETSYHFKRGIK